MSIVVAAMHRCVKIQRIIESIGEQVYVLRHAMPYLQCEGCATYQPEWIK